MRQFSIIVFAGLAFGSEVHAAQGPSEAEKTARAFLELLNKGDFDAAVKDFDATMTKVMPKEKLEEVWKSLVEKLGPLKKLGKSRSEKKGAYNVAIVTCKFGEVSLDARVVFDKDKKIAGLFFVPPQPATPYTPPAYADVAAFQESDITVGTGEWAVPGTLSMPKGDGPFPVVILVAGSGPQDRDETVGPNKPLKDIAWGLASRKVAVLRFDRRAFTHGKKVAAIIDKFTVKEEVIDDVYSAVALLKAHKGIDAGRIYVLGHSLGALLGPRMALGNEDIRGLILMAGPARPLEDLVLEQITYLASLEGPLTDKTKATLEKIKAQAARVRDPKLSAAVPSKDLPIGIPANYWLSLRGDLPPEAARKLARPMLILQGERDYQVTMEDFHIWSKALKDRKDVMLKSYPRLHHLFLEGTGKGKSRPSEYERAEHVPLEVIEDIAGWIKKLPR